MTASDQPRNVHLTYHHEEGSWWAESHQLPGLFAGGDSLDDAKKLARQVVEDELGDNVTLSEWMPVPSALERLLAGGADEEPASKGSDGMTRGMQPWPGPESFDMDSDPGQASQAA